MIDNYSYLSMELPKQEHSGGAKYTPKKAQIIKNKRKNKAGKKKGER